MKDFRLAMVQHDSYLGKRKENFALTVEYVRKAKEAGADLVVFPEIGITGHAGHESIKEYAERVPEGESVQKLISLAKELDIYIVAAVAESADGVIYNTSFIVGPDGYIGKQRKIHLSLDEVKYFTPGDSIDVIELPFAKVGIIICYDCTFPELSRILAVKGAELLLFCNASRHVDTTWVEWSDNEEELDKYAAGVKEYLSIVTRCRAIENRSYVGVCNMTGESGKYVGVKSNHAGGSFIINPYGKILAESKPKIANEMIVADIKAEVLEPLRTWENSFNVKRRPELYGVLTEPKKV